MNSDSLAPARLAPVFMPRIWGARNLSPLFPEKSQEAEPLGEVWLTGDACKFATGQYAGQTLGEVWPELGEKWAGTRLSGLAHIPLLVKFVFAQDKLSVQVHPDDAYAEQHEAAAGGVGKTEMWYVVRVQGQSELRVGLEANVTQSSFRGAIERGTVESCLHALHAHEGEAIFVPAGTPHMIGPGFILCEVQEHSDITYRVYDYDRVDSHGRRRGLHVRQALDVIRFDDHSAGLCDPISVTQGPLHKTIFAACRYFATERWSFSDKTASVTSPEHFDLLIFLSGSGRIESAAGVERYGAADLWMFPAALGRYELMPETPTVLLRTYVPNLQDFIRELADQRVAESEWSRVVHP